MVNKLLMSANKVKKVYEVLFSKEPSAYQIQQLRKGVEIQTILKKTNRSVEYNAKTLPCEVVRVDSNPKMVRMTLIQGRNR